MTITLDLPPYLAQWYVFTEGGDVPVSPRRGSIEADLLETFLQRPPKDWTPGDEPEGSVTVRLPQFRSKDTRICFWLSPSARSLIEDAIRTRFDVCMWQELHRFSNIFRRRDRLIYAFMEKYGIEPTETNWCAIEKRYRRKSDVYRKTKKKA